VKRILGALLGTWLGLHAGAALGACDVSFSLVDFGRVDLARGGEITGRVTVACDRPRRFELAASAGQGRFGQRLMRGPGGTPLAYNLYVDPARTRIWGDGVHAGTSTIGGRSDGRRRVDLAVYGRVWGRQSVAPGAYSDTVSITVER
jgi:spore coat protein U-like protein